jgi:hypothetical protein
MKEKKGGIMLNNWDEGDFQQALSNYERMLIAETELDEFIFKEK